ncbi:MAG: small basic protein [Planctomycetia bacterium]|jgi:small basic protein (TIGR04137 family)
MSIHSSLKIKGIAAGSRSVFTRVERIAILKKAGKFDEAGSSPCGLPKVRTTFKTIGAKKKDAAPAADAKAGDKKAAPAAGAKAAAPAKK